MFPTIAKLIKNSKEWLEGNNDTVFLALAVFLGVLLAGGGFRLYTLWQERVPITLVEENKTDIVLEENLTEKYATASGLPGLVAASRNGKRYYYPWCGGLNRIKEINKIWFKTVAEAERAGYTLASGCDEL